MENLQAVNKIQDSKILNIIPANIEYVYDNLQTNAISFTWDNNYFTIATGEILEEDDDPDYIEFELNDQGNFRIGNLDKVVFYNDRLEIIFTDLYLKKYEKSVIHTEVNKKIVDFFINYLFLYKFIIYDDSFNTSNIVEKERVREYY